MSRTRTVTVREIDVGVALTARPGDKLLVMGDVCIGVDTARPPAPTPKAQPAKAAPVALNSKGKPKVKNHPGKPPSDERAQVRERLTKALRENKGELDAKALYRAAAIPPGDARLTYHVRRALEDMKKDGALRISGPPGSGRVYTLKDTPAERVREAAHAAE